MQVSMTCLQHDGVNSILNAHVLQDLKFVDSLDKDKSFGIWSYIDIPDPDKGEDGYPRLLIENRAYRNRVFRKLHMELAHRQDGLQVWQHASSHQHEASDSICATYDWLSAVCASCCW